MTGFSMARGLLPLLLAATARGAALRAGRRASWKHLQQYTFTQFVQEFNRTYEPGSGDWAKREQLFGRHLQQVIEFQQGPSRSWSMGITKFMDFEDHEYKAVLGYKGHRAQGSFSEGNVELLRTRHPKQPPSLVNVIKNLTGGLGSLVRDQGSCGSCWAEATVSVLEGHLENNDVAMKALSDVVKSVQRLPTLSSQAIVSCTPNPRHCGGKGGCDGATAELAFEMIQKRGLPLATEWSYTSGSGATPQCRDDVFNKVRLGITGYKVLPSNKLHPLKQALFESNGPIVVSVDATNWAFYSGGIFTDTDMGRKGDFQVNHAVTLTAYKEPAGAEKGYWTIKNSWGSYWGEDGFIRLEMKPKEEEHCGMDYKTHEGLACDGDPDTAWVCGTCGVLYDSSYPLGTHLVTA